MSTVRWYGPTLVLIIAVLIVMIAGPGLSRRLAYEYKAQKIDLVREQLEAESSPLAALSTSFRNVSTIVEPSVVHIEVLAKAKGSALDQFFGPESNEVEGDIPRQYSVPRSYGNGSGWVYDEHGHVITNYHVVAGADLIRLRFVDGTVVKAEVVGYDERTDIAVLKVVTDYLYPAKRAHEDVAQGDLVFAFGSPFRFDFSMSQGVVSATNRRNLGILRADGYEDFIQTDAAINPGNSGGPLTNIRGEVVGMNTAIASARTGPQEEASFSGLGFAIPVRMVEFVADQIIEKGEVARGYLGVYIADLSPAMAATFGFDGEGVLVDRPNDEGPAYRAGMRRGDIVTRINGQQVTSVAQLRGIVSNVSPESRITIDIIRDGEKQTLEATVTTLPDDVSVMVRRMDLRGQPNLPSPPTLQAIGVESYTPFTPELAARSGVKHGPGVIARKIRRGSVAWAPDVDSLSDNLLPSARQPVRQRIPEEAVITHVMGKPVNSVEELEEELSSYNINNGIRISISVNGVPRYVLMQVDDQ